VVTLTIVLLIIDYTLAEQDKNTRCPLWASKGKCAEKPGYYGRLCPLSCGKGGGNTAPTAAPTTGSNELTSKLKECTARLNDYESKGLRPVHESFTCTCNAGFTEAGKICTRASNACSSSDECDTNAECSNSVCTCQAGHTGDGKTCTGPPQNFVAIGSHYYYFSPPGEMINRTQAAAACTARSSSLLILEDQEEYNALRAYMDSNAVGDGHHWYWMALERQGNTYNYMWVDGTELNVNPPGWYAYGKTHPNPRAGHCVLLLSRPYHFMFFRKPCSYSHKYSKYICKV